MKRILFVFIALLHFVGVEAQTANSHTEFDTFAKIYQEGNGFVLKAPNGYADAGRDPFHWSPASHKHSRGEEIYRMRLHSKSDDVLIIYPSEGYFRYNPKEQSGELVGVSMYIQNAKEYPNALIKLNAMTGLQEVTLPEEAKQDYVKYSGRNVRKWFNADRVYVADFKLEKPFDEKYTHAMVVTFHQTGKRMYEVVCFFKNDDQKLRSKVFDDLKGNIMLYDNGEYTYKTNGASAVKIFEKWGNNYNDKYLSHPLDDNMMRIMRRKVPGRI